MIIKDKQELNRVYENISKSIKLNYNFEAFISYKRFNLLFLYLIYFCIFSNLFLKNGIRIHIIIFYDNAQ